jgi:hypothetical protein
MHRRQASIWATAARAPATRIKEGTPETLTVTGTTATVTATVAAIGIGTRTVGITETAGIGVTVAARPLRGVGGIRPTAAAGATPEVPQEAAAHAAITIPPLLPWQLRRRTLVGKSHHAAPCHRHKKSRGKTEGQEVKYPMMKRFPWRLKFQIFFYPIREDLDPIR